MATDVPKILAPEQSLPRLQVEKVQEYTMRQGDLDSDRAAIAIHCAINALLEREDATPEMRTAILDTAATIFGVIYQADEELHGSLIASLRSRLRAVTTETEQLRVETLTDQLTQVANRRGFDEHGPQAFEDCTNKGRPLACLFIDLDHFKAVNDTHGHEAGDKVLRQLGKILNAHVKRSEDLVARYGGEEFVVLLPGMALEHVNTFAIGLLTAIASHDFDIGDQAPLKVTASIGAALRKDGDPSLKELTKRADSAVYNAKKAGRNRVIIIA